jgi:hypothetical protein
MCKKDKSGNIILQCVTCKIKCPTALFKCDYETRYQDQGFERPAKPYKWCKRGSHREN